MVKMKKWLTVILLMQQVLLSAQEVSGVVVDVENRPVAYATVALLQKGDSALVGGCTTDEGGRFSLAADMADKLLRVSCIGYATAYAVPAKNMTITLQSADLEVEGVVVKGNRPTYRMVGGALEATIEKTVLSNLGDAMDVLEQLPFINSDGKGVSVLGRGTPVIYINHRKVNDQEELRLLDSRQVKSVLIEMTPGAKYSSKVKSVIRITTTQSLGQGLGGYVNTELRQGDYFSHHEWTHLNYRHKQTDIFAGASFLDNKKCIDREDTHIFQHGGNDYLAQEKGWQKSQPQQLRGNIGINHQLTPRQYVSMQYRYTNNLRTDYKTFYDNVFTGGGEDSQFYSECEDGGDGIRHSLVAYYVNELSKKWSLQVDGTFVHTASNSDFEQTENRRGKDSFFATESGTRANLYALKAVVTTKIGTAELEWGTEGNYTNSRQHYNVIRQTDTGIPANDAQSKQSSTSIFATYKQGVGEFSWQAGLRYEFTDFNYYRDGVRVAADSRRYHNLLPVAVFSWHHKKTSMSLSYRVRVARPSYGSLQSGITYVNSRIYSQGNPLLRPAYIHGLSLMFVHRDIQAIADFYHLKDNSYSIMSFYNDKPIILKKRENFTHNVFSARVSYSPTIAFWKPIFTASIACQHLRYMGRTYDQPVFVYMWKNLLTLPHKWTIVLNANGHTHGNGEFYTSRALLPTIDGYVSKRLNSWTFRAGMQDILHTAREDGYTQIGPIYYNHWADLRSRQVYLRVTYHFNQTKSKYKEGTAGQDELNRL